MSESATDRHGLEVLPEEECWRLLERAVVGRLAVVVAGRPRIFPVNHRVDERAIVFVSAPGTKLHQVLQQSGTPVAYEVDGVDEEFRSGWSVVAEGRGEAVLDEIEQARLDRLGIPAWADVLRDRRWIRVRVDAVSGRRL